MEMLSCLWHTAGGVAALGLVYECGHFRQTTASCWGSAFREDRLLFPSIWPDGSVRQTSGCDTDNQRSNELSCGSHLMSFVTVLLLEDQGSEMGWTGFCAASLRELHRIRCCEVQKCSRKCLHRGWEDSLLGHQNPSVFLCLPQQKPMVMKMLSLDNYILVLFYVFEVEQAFLDWAGLLGPIFINLWEDFSFQWNRNSSVSCRQREIFLKCCIKDFT